MQFKRTAIEYGGREKYGTPGTGNKYRKKSVTYGNITYAGGGGGGGLTPVSPTGSTFDVTVEALVPISNINIENLTAEGYTIQIPINGFANNEETEVWVGTFTGTSADNFGISGCTTGLSVTSITDNGTIAPVVNVKFTNQLSLDSGELQIPVYVNASPYLEAFSGATSWSEMNVKKKLTPKVITYCWNIKSAGGGSGYIFDLTNENASVNADVDGNIYSASVQSLQCQAILYYDNVAATGVSYTISVPTGTTGVSVNQSTGVLTFNPQTFTFTGMATNITVTAAKDGVSMTKIMRITKVKDGAGGASTSRWILPSVYSVVKAIDGTVAPSAVSATVMVQTAGNPAEVDTATTIFYGFAPDYINPTIPMPSTGITISDSVEYLVLALRDGNVYNGTIYESETIPVISEGAGPAIRGPIRWYSSLTRRFSNGVGPQQIDRNFIDIVKYVNHTYRCITSYTQTSGQTWAQVSENWVLDDSYRLIAAGLDLEADETISIRPSNSIEFINASNNVTGKITNTTIMLGGTNPSTAPVYINNGGQIRSNTLIANGAVYSNDFLSEFASDRYVKAVMSPFKMKMVMSTDDKSLFGIDNEIWTFNGLNTEVDANEFPYIRVCERETDQDFAGWWIASDSESMTSGERYAVLGVASSSAARQNDIIYLNL